MTAEAAPLSYAEFDRVDIRVGRIVAADDFPEARKPAYKLRIDFGAGII
jgi:tRNA-binding protein